MDQKEREYNPLWPHKPVLFCGEPQALVQNLQSWRNDIENDALARPPNKRLVNQEKNAHHCVWPQHVVKDLLVEGPVLLL
jgi:hypothetical protein